MENLDNNQIEPNQTHDVADETVVPNGAENRADHENNRIHIVNNSEWTEEQKHALVKIDAEERRRGRGFMRRIKQRWCIAFPNDNRTAQNLTDNAKRFKKEGFGRENNNQDEEVQIQPENIRTGLEWTTEMKVTLVRLDEEERGKGRGFMKRVKERWDVKYPEYQSASWQKLRDNASRFKRDTELRDLMLVRQREEMIDRVGMEVINEEVNVNEHTLREEEREHGVIEDADVVEDESNSEGELEAEIGLAHEEEGLDGEVDVEDEAGLFQIDEDLTEKDKEMERFFSAELQKLQHSTMTHMEPRDKLPKVKVDVETQERANKILNLYLPNTDTIPEITDMVYAMGKAVAYSLGVVPKENNESRTKKAENGNRRERKLKVEMKKLRQNIARAGNELHRRKQKRKSTRKEKEIAKDLRTQMNGRELTSKNIRAAKEEWLDTLRYKKVKLQKYTEKGNRKKDNTMFQKDQKTFFRSLEKEDKHEGQMPEMNKFVEFWGGIWEQEEQTPNMPWMEEVKALLNEKVNVVNEFEITEEKMRKETSKRKNWTAPGIDGIQNHWWKKFPAAQTALTKAFTSVYQDTRRIPDWWPTGRTVLLPKTKNLSDEKNYRPITCLNTSYKILTGLVAKYMREHAVVNEIWDTGQLGAVEGVLGTVDQLIIDRCIMEEAKEYHRNLAVAFYDYKKAYDKVHHDWMTRVYEWIGIPRSVVHLIVELMRKWRTRLEIWTGNEKVISRWIRILCGFLQGDSYSPVGFCVSEIPVCVLLQRSKGYRMGEPGNRNVKRTHSLFVDDLKVYQESHKALKNVNEMIVQASHDTGACYGVSKCAEIVFERGKMVKGEGLQMLEERMTTMSPDENEIYKFLGIEQADGIKTKRVFERVKNEVKKRVKLLVNTQLNDVNLIRAINTKVIPAAAYPMNVCKFSKGELNELDQIVKKELRMKKMFGRQSSDERLYLKREDGGRGLKSMRDTYEETRLRVACYMACSDNKWISATWRREILKEENSISDEAIKTMDDVGVTIQFEEKNIRINEDIINGGWKPAWKRLKEKLKAGHKNKRIEEYGQKEQQSRVYKAQESECHVWLFQNLNPGKVASIMSMLEQMIETRAWKKARGLTESGECRLCHQYSETIEHLVAGCKILASSEYLTRHNRTLMVMAVAWAKNNDLIGQEAIWYEQKWVRGTTLENHKAKLVWDFEFRLRKTTTARRPDLILELKEQKKIWICDMACPQSINIEEKRTEKLTKYRQLAFETRERRPNYEVYVVPVVLGALGGGIKLLHGDLKKLFEEKEQLAEVIATMQKTVLMDSESITRRVMSGLIQGED